MTHIDWFSFVLGANAIMCSYQIGCMVDRFCDRMIDYYQRKLDERSAQ